MAGFGEVSALASILAAACLVACGGGGGASTAAFGPDPDFSKLDATLGAPTGTLSAPAVSGAARVLDAMQSQELSIDVLATVTPSRTTCAALGHHDTTGVCACPGGGTFDYDFQELATSAHDGAPATLRLRLLQCGAQSGVVLDGEEFAVFQGGAVTARTAHLTATAPAANGAPALPAGEFVVWSAATSGNLWARVTVSDGAIVVGAAARATGADAPTSNQVVVKDRHATWTCSVREAEPRCATPEGGEHATKT